MIYDRNYHKEYRKRCPDMGNISFGYLHWDIDCDLVDLGSVNSILDELKNIPSEVVPKILIEPSNFKPERGKVLMWKLFEKSQTNIEPVKNYLNDKEELLWSRYEKMRESYINSLPKFEVPKINNTISQIDITQVKLVQIVEEVEADDSNLIPELEHDSESTIST